MANSTLMIPEIMDAHGNGRAYYEADAKNMYGELVEFYSSHSLKNKSIRAEIKIYAGIYNHDRILFKKGIKKWEAEVMKQFHDIENNPESIEMHMVETEEGQESSNDISTYNGLLGVSTGEAAVFSLGDMIRLKRTQHKQMSKFLSGCNWWRNSK